jgi:cobalt-zinc-cadmium efflux system protein
VDELNGRASTLRRALALTAVILVVELAGGLLSHSLALLSDAGHVLTDVFALGLAWFAIEQSKRPADRRRSYGYQRVSILAALVNAVTLIVIVLAIGFEAVRRLMAPEPVQGGIVIVSALIGIAVNSYVILGLRGVTNPGVPAESKIPWGGKSLNIRAAFLHVAGDIAASIGVVVAGAVILLTGWLYIDPLLSIGIAALIAYGAWGIVRETVNLLMEGTPTEVDLGQVTIEIAGTERVTSLHDLHVWALSSDETALSVHVVVGDCPLADAEHLVRDLEQRLCSRFDIGHTTIQVESCHPCGEIEHGAGAHNHPHEHVRVLTSSSSALPRAAGSGEPGR